MPSKPTTAHLVILLGCIFSITSLATAQNDKYQVTPGKTDVDGFPVTGATVCQNADHVCFQMQNLHRADVTYQFALEPHVRAVTGDISPWLLFDATFSGGGSGTLTRYAILKRSGRSLTDLLPNVALTNQSDLAVWNDATLSAYPVLVTADFVWDFKAGETHLSKHRFAIEVWRYSKNSGIYSKVLSYRTAQKYDGLDEVDKINVIAPERGEILRRLSLNPNR